MRTLVDIPSARIRVRLEFGFRIFHEQQDPLEAFTSSATTEEWHPRWSQRDMHCSWKIAELQRAGLEIYGLEKRERTVQLGRDDVRQAP
jgi:hypothetical protein